MTVEITHSEPSSYTFDIFRVDVRARLLYDVDGRTIPLKPKVFDTLLYLVSNSGKVIEKDELMSAIWVDTTVEENNLNKNISVLRRILGENPREHRFIVTVPGKGYRFVAAVSEQTGESRSEVTEVKDPSEPEFQFSNARPQHKKIDSERQRTTTKAIRRFWLATITLAVCSALVFLGYYSWSQDRTGASIRSIAVLPLVNAGDEAELEYLAEGVSETLIDMLSELPELKVIARASSFKYRGENVDLQDAAQKLGVQAMLTGRIARVGDDLIFRIRLIDARDNKQIWGEQFVRRKADLPALESEIARTVSGKLRLKLSGGQKQQLDKRGTDNGQARDLVLKGDFLYNRTSTRMKALEFYGQATTLDPNYALAYSRLAKTYQTLAGGSVLDPKEVLPIVRAAANRAIELDESSADAHFVLAELARDSWDWKTAEHEYMRALELNPNLSGALSRYSSYLGIMGRRDQAISVAKRVQEVDPQQLMSHLAVPSALYLARRWDESIAESRKTLELGPIYGASAIIGHAYAGKGMQKEAIAAYQEAIRLGGNDTYLKICLGASYAHAGERVKAKAILKQLEESRGYISHSELSVLYAALGEREKAFASLEKAYAAHDLQMQYLNADVGFDALRDDPRFHDLLRRVGLPQ